MLAAKAKPPAGGRLGAPNGLLASVLALAVAFVVSLAANAPFLPNAVAGRIMEATPAAFAVVLLGALGLAAKPFALAGALALLSAMGALAGGVGAARLRPAPRALNVLAVLAAALAQAAAAYVLAEPRSLFAVGITYVLWPLAFFALSSLHVPEGNASRRWFLNRGVQAAAGLVLLSTATTWTLLARTLAGARPGRLLFPFQSPAPRQPTFAAAVGLTPEVTPVTSFYLMSKTVEDPAVAAGTWRLRIDGLVRQPLDLRYDDLLQLPRVDQWMTLRCVSNPVGGPLISNALWSGASLPALLNRAGVRREATTLVLKARDTYSDSFPLDRAMLPTTLLAYAINGGLLNRDHGYPARVLVPGLYGFKNVKWVEELELVAGDYAGPWQRLGWTRTAIQTTFSRIDFVRRTGREALAGGIAFAGDRGIRAVEVRVNDLPFRQAELNAPPLGPLSWVQWLFPFQASGLTRVTVRAIDGTGALQEEAQRGIFPDGATGWHTITASLQPLG